MSKRITKIEAEGGRLIELQENGKTVWSREQEFKEVKQEAKVDTVNELESQGVIPSGTVDKVKKNMPKDVKQKLKDKGVI